MIPEEIYDEYNDLIMQILTILHNGTTIELLSEHISREVSDKYGIAMQATDKDAREVSAKILMWWRSA